MTNQIKLSVPTMNCQKCVNSITKAIQTVDASAVIIADTSTKQLEIKTTGAESIIIEAIHSAGYQTV